MNLKKQGRVFLDGLIVLVPIIVTIWLVGMTVFKLDEGVRQVIDFFYVDVFGGTIAGGQEHAASPGVGFGITIVLIYLVGLAAHTWLLRWPLRKAEQLVDRIPLVKSLYSAVKDLLQFLGGGEAKSRGRPCVLRSEDGKMEMLGVVTQPQPRQFLPGDEDRIAVYLPMSYQLGGYTLYVPPRLVETIDDMSVEELMKLCMTAGVGAKLRRSPLDAMSSTDSEKTEKEEDGTDENPPG